MGNDEFRFKKFSVRHGNAAMKVGVDGVLLGAWARASFPRRILDVGTGCGVIALIMSFRYPEATVTGIDIDTASVEEAAGNFKNSGRGEKLQALQLDFPNQLNLLKHEEKEFENKEWKYDLIVSNPPFYNSGITEPQSRRERARHQSSLSVYSLIDSASTLLAPHGILAIIFPSQFKEETVGYAEQRGLAAVRECLVKDNDRRPVKRMMIEFSAGSSSGKETVYDTLTMFQADGQPTEKYRELCKDLYLKF